LVRTPAATRPRILVVDDDPSIRDLLSLVLQDEGYDVRTAADGPEALDVLGRCPPSLIVLDLMMPGMDGFEFVSKVRRKQQWQAIPIAVLTAKELTTQDRRRLNGKVERILQKGASSREELLAEVADLVRRASRAAAPR
jgi:CheY-like chemotaxis protein